MLCDAWFLMMSLYLLATFGRGPKEHERLRQMGFCEASQVNQV